MAKSAAKFSEQLQIHFYWNFLFNIFIGIAL